MTANIFGIATTTRKVSKYEVFSGPNTGKYEPQKLHIWTFFAQCTCTTLTVIAQVWTTIFEHVGHKYLCLPNNDEEIREKISEFERKFAMIQVFGCFDCTRKLIICPTENSYT